MATSNQDTNIKDVAAPASATTTNIGHVLGLNAAKTQDVLIPLSMLRTVIAAELKTALAAITSGSPDVPVLDGNNLKYMTLANFAKVVGGLKGSFMSSGTLADLPQGLVFVQFQTFEPSDMPSDDYDISFVFTFVIQDNVRLQFCIKHGHMAFRRRYGASYSVWTTVI